MNPYEQMLAFQGKFRQLNMYPNILKEFNSSVGNIQIDAATISDGQNALRDASAAITGAMGDASKISQQISDSYKRVQDAISAAMGDSATFWTQVGESQSRMQESINAAVAPLKNIDWDEVDRRYRENYHFHLCLLCELEAANQQMSINDKLDLGDVHEFSNSYLETVSNALKIHLDSDLYPLWQGAVISLSSDNPDRVRHCFISIRTIIEFLANTVLNITGLDVKEYVDKTYDIGKQPGVKLKLKTFFTKTEFDIVEEIGELHVRSFCQYYALLSSLHSPTAGQKYNDEQVRIIMIKTGILIWAIVQRDKMIKGVLEFND